MSFDKNIQDVERTVSSIWKLGAFTVAIFSAGFASNVWLTRNVVRYGDEIFLDVEAANTRYRVNVDIGAPGGGSGQPLYLDSRPGVAHNFEIKKVEQ